MTKKLIGFLLGISFFSAELFAENQTAIRAAIDVGMGGPKLQIAEVDLTNNKIVKIVHTQRYFVNFYESLSQSADKRLSFEIMEQGLKAVKDAVETAQAFQATKIVSIATASFRHAANGVEFAHRIEDETSVKVHIIDQNLEGKLTFQAVLSKLDVKPVNLVVWDIGGGSIQFIGAAENNSYFYDCSSEGVGSFTEFIIETIQKRSIKECKSPNPMSTEEISQATADAVSLSQRVNKVVREKISHASTIVVGAGSVFGCSIATWINNNPFSTIDLNAAVQSLAGKTDEDLGGGDYAFCGVSNAILALGYMRGLGITKMHIINVNNADGALLYEPFWSTLN